MHTAHQLHSESFDLEIDGGDVDLSGLFPDRNRFDRFGIVVAEPLGSLGASLLIQAAIADWFEVRPERRGDGPAYPEIYLFHAGGPHGDHSYFDFWPPRKEVFVEAGNPVGLLAQINARAITRLALPEVEPGDPDRLTSGPSTWSEQGAALDRLRSCFVYSPSGRVDDADVRISSSDPRLEENPHGSLDPVAVAETVRGNEGNPDFLPGPSVSADNVRWIATVEARRDEIPVALRERLAREREEDRERAGGTRTETYRRVDTETALAMIAGLDRR